MFTSNKYVNRSFSVLTNNIQTTNCIASNIQTNNISDLTILGINNNNPRFTLDVNGNVNITGKLFKNPKLFGLISLCTYPIECKNFIPLIAC